MSLVAQIQAKWEMILSFKKSFYETKRTYAVVGRTAPLPGSYYTFILISQTLR